MDPNATLRMIQEALEDHDTDAAKYLKWSLFQWLSRGGFEPDWERYPNATMYYRKRFPKRNPLRGQRSWYVGITENGVPEIKKIVSAIREKWIQAYGPFESKKDADKVYQILLEKWPRNNPMRHERIVSPSALRRRGLTKYRSKVTPSGHVLRIACPEGRRRRGSGEVQAILHPENPSRRVVIRPSKYRGKSGFTVYEFDEPGFGSRSKIFVFSRESAERIKAKLLKGERPSLEDFSESIKSQFNPPKTKIYSRTIEIVASKAGMPHKCDAACKRAGHRYRHVFKDKKSGIYGLENGRILIGS